ncbi:MAG: hypothetical protein FWD25_12280 [Clostridia bacterium]|nr:hypothetical protein [Clostridia bacterium]
MIALGIDAGGTKTIFSLCDGIGRVLCTVHRPSIALPRLGEDAQREALLEGVQAALKEAGLSVGSPLGLSAVCFGAPCWGESQAGDEAMRRSMGRIFGDTPWLLCNDAQVAWAGSFALRPGINILAGTGAMAFGMDAKGRMARCGGWGEHFADEGSGYWLGKRMLSLFCKEADGRAPKGALYALVRQRFALDSDFEIIDVALRDYLPYRDKVASLQLLLLEAARQGDESAIDCYREAGREIALNIEGILQNLDFSGGAQVSYSGGIFKVGAWVMDSFCEALKARGCTIVQPLAPPWIGALMTALQLVGADTNEAIQRLKEESTCHW